VKKQLGFVLATTLIVAAPAFAQREEREGGNARQENKEKKKGKDERKEDRAPRGNNGRIPPPPERRPQGRSEREGEPRERGKWDKHPHVNNDRWYGHERVDDRRFHIARPYEHGRFERFGPSIRYRVIGLDRHYHRFWFRDGFFFEIASWDWGQCQRWCWDCGDDFVVYEDPDHIGWYLLYNSDTGVFVHVQYIGIH